MADSRLTKSLTPYAKGPARKKTSRQNRPPLLPAIVVALVAAVGLFSLPSLLAIDLQVKSAQPAQQAFPVTVVPQEKKIVYDPRVEALLRKQPTALSASAGLAGQVFQWLAIQISDLPMYRALAGTDTLFVTVEPGYRAEEVANVVGSALHWNGVQKKAFLKDATSEDGLADGEFVPGTYFLSVTDPDQVAGLFQQRFQQEILARYSTTTQEQVPLKEALIIASLIEREAGGWDDMRLISGVIWNRLFNNMNLQIDATLQYAKATNDSRIATWWPTVLPADKNIRSAYNTYQHPGLPPSPIAEPSVAAVIAALNPMQTDCLFYFHDAEGNFHCSATYQEHVALLKKYYGQGK